MKMKRTVTALLLCLVLCVALLSVSAFAEQTVVIIGGAIKNEASVVTQGTAGSQGATVITGGTGTATTVISGTGSASAAQNNAASSSTGSVIVMPDGSVVTSRPAQTTQTVVTTTAGEAAQTQAAPSAAQNTLLNEIYNRINQERTANGLGILGYDTALQATADLRAKESARCWRTSPRPRSASMSPTVRSLSPRFSQTDFQSFLSSVSERASANRRRLLLFYQHFKPNRGDFRPGFTGFRTFSRSNSGILP